MHIRTMKDYIEKNLQAFWADRSSDFIIIASGDREECDRAASIARRKLQDRDPGRKHGHKRN